MSGKIVENRAGLFGSLLRWSNTVLARAFVMQISTCTRISKDKHAINRAIILFTQHPHYLCYFYADAEQSALEIGTGFFFFSSW